MTETLAPKRLIAERRYAEAIVACRRLLLGEEDVEVRLLLGQALLAEERFDDVRVEMLTALRAHPGVAAAHRLLGEAYLRSGQKDRAVEELTKAAELDPAEPETKELLEEAAAESFPVASTIERWFGDTEGRTVETELPAFEDEATPVPALAPAQGGRFVLEPSIQVDPALSAEALRLESEFAETGTTLESADSTLPSSPPARGGRLTELLAKASSKAPPRAAAAAAVPRPSLLEAPAPAAGATQLARPSARPAEGRAPARGPLSAAASATAPAVSGSSPRGSSRAAAPPPETMELSLVELAAAGSAPDEDAIDDGAGSEEFTRPLPALSTVAFSPSSAPLPARPAASRLAAGPVAGSGPAAPSAPPPGAAARPSVAPAARPPAASVPPSAPAPARPLAAPPSVRPSAGPPRATPAPLPMLGAGRLPSAAPRDRAAAASTEPSPLLPPTAPEIALAGPVHPQRGLDAPPARSAVPGPGLVVPPTAVHAAAPPRAAASRLALPYAQRRAFGVAAIVTGLAGLVALSLGSGGSALDRALETCSADGRPDSFEAAIALAPADGDADERSLRALLLALAASELGADRGAEVEALLAGLDPETAGGPAARVARSLALSSSGRGTQALTVLSGLGAEGVLLVEGFRARARVLAQVGTLAEAIEAARQAATLSPGASRHAALLAELSVLAGDLPAAQRVLDGIVGLDGEPALVVVRAELAAARGLDPAAAAADADAVLGPLASRATSPELGRAHLVRAGLALGRRDAAGARAELDLAEPLVPRADERRRLQLAERYLAAGAADRALAVGAALAGDTGDPFPRAELVVAAALVLRDLPAIERAVAPLPAGPRVDLLRGQLSEAAGRSDEARALYARAALDRTLTLAARTAEGRVLLVAGRPREAVVALTQALSVSSAAPTAVLLFVRAALATGELAEAARVAGAAFAIASEEPEILAAHALVLRARARFDEACPALERASAARPEDGLLRLELGHCALALGRLDDAASAYEAALGRGLGEGALGLVQLGIERGDLAAAEAALARAGAAPELLRRRAEATLLAARGAGRSGTDALARLREGRSADPVLAVALAALYLEAEQDDRARELSRVALRADPSHPEALLVTALVEAHEGRRSAAATIASADQGAAERGAGPSLRARVGAVRARIAFDEGDRTEARRLADQALALDPHCAEAHLVLADLETEAARDPIPALRAAASGTYPLGEALGRLALRLGPDAEGCALGRRFLEVAPQGYDARDVRDLLEGCR